MKAVVLTGLRRLEWADVPDRELEHEDDVLLQVETVGVCGSDLHYFETGRIGARAVKFPFLLGHECSARVLEVGRRVTRVKPGDRVAVDPAVSCFACDQCRSGRPHTCRHLRFLGCPDELPGCLSEKLVMPERCLYPVTGRLSSQQAALCEPLSIGVYAVRQAGPVASTDVAILGSGPIGLCVLLAAREASVGRVWMTDRIDQRVTFAKAMGADWSANPDQSDIVAGILDQCPEGLDVVFECAGQQATLDQAVQLLKPGGRLMIIGIPREERISFDIDLLRRKEITLINVRRQNDCVASAIELAASVPQQVDRLVTHRFAPQEAQQAFELVEGYRDGVIKAVIEFSPTNA